MSSALPVPVPVPSRPGRKAPRAEAPPTRTIGFVLVPDFPLMAYTAAVEPLRAANTLSGCPLYEWWHAAPGGGPVRASNGITILTDVEVGAASLRPDRVFVCAGGNPAAFDDPALSAWLRDLARAGATIGGISGGPYVLARAGLLDGRRCTLHWEHVPAFEERYPEIDVVRSLFEVQGDRVTCSGGIAALDLMLSLIEEDHGPGLAAGVSDWFLHNQIREGLSPQRMDLRQRFGVRDPRLLRVLAAMEAHLETPLSREALAELARVSVRQLERLFSDLLGRGLHRHYLELRLDRAHQLARESALSRAEIATATGFANADELSRAERRRRARSAAPDREGASRGTPPPAAGWRHETGGTPMADVAQIQEHAEVVGSDGAHVGTVDHVDKGQIKLTKKDADAGGLHHYIPAEFVQSIEGGKVRLDRPAEEVKREWSTS